MEHTLDLLRKAHEGDKAARDTLVEENMGLVWSIVRRFTGRGVEAEDLFQIGSIGLLKAIDKFDMGYDVQLTIYQGEGNDISLEDRLEEKSCAQDRLLDRLLLEETLDKLEARERQIIYLRYFEEKTQTEIARELGISQVQVSRMEKKILGIMKGKILGE